MGLNNYLTHAQAVMYIAMLAIVSIFLGVVFYELVEKRLTSIFKKSPKFSYDKLSIKE